MIKAVPYIQTIGSKKFKEFITQPFTVDMLYPVFNEKSCVTLFDGWRGKNMNNWHRFTCDEYVLEFYSTHIIIRLIKSNTQYQMPIPQSINAFIHLMNMFGVQLYWTNWIDENFEPKDYLQKEEIKQYYIDLLRKLDKSNELQ